MMKKIVYLAVTLMLLTSFANADDVRTKIKARTAEYIALWSSGDHEGVLAMYDKGFSIAPQGSDLASDRDAFRQVLVTDVKEYDILKLETTTLKVHGNYAFEIGVDIYRAKGEEGDDAIEKEDYLFVWKKDDKGVWNIHVEIFWGAETDAKIDAAVLTKIKARSAELIEAWNNDDPEGVFAIYDKGFVYIPEKAERISGLDVNRKQLASDVKDYGIVEFATSSLKVHGNYAYEIGVDTWTEKGGDETGKGDYLTVWKKDDKGVWNIYLDVYWGVKSDE